MKIANKVIAIRKSANRDKQKQDAEIAKRKGKTYKVSNDMHIGRLNIDQSDIDEEVLELQQMFDDIPGIDAEIQQDIPRGYTHQRGKGRETKTA